MNRALVVMDPGEAAKDLLAEAGDCVSCTGADIVLLAMITEDSRDRDIEILDQIGKVEDRSYGDQTPVEGAKRFVADIADDVLDDSIEYTAVSRLIGEGDGADTILSIGEQFECDHIFITGRKRSPTGKAVFGDRAQAVILNFDDYVTVATTD